MTVSIPEKKDLGYRVLLLFSRTVSKAEENFTFAFVFPPCAGCLACKVPSPELNVRYAVTGFAFGKPVTAIKASQLSMWPLTAIGLPDSIIKI